MAQVIYDVSSISTEKYPVIFDPDKISFTTFEPIYRDLPTFHFDNGGAISIAFHNSSIALSWIAENLAGNVSAHDCECL